MPYILHNCEIDLQGARTLIGRAEDLPIQIVDIRSGKQLKIPEQLTWLHFSHSDQGLFTMYQSWKLAPEWVDSLCRMFSSRLGIEFTREHFILMRSVGDIPIHKDYGPEASRINIGLQNSRASRTQFYDEDGQPTKCLQMQDGLSVVFDPRHTHQVFTNQSNDRSYRYLGALAVFHSADKVGQRSLEQPLDRLSNSPVGVLKDGALSVDHEFPNERKP